MSSSIENHKLQLLIEQMLSFLVEAVIFYLIRFLSKNIIKLKYFFKNLKWFKLIVFSSVILE